MIWNRALFALSGWLKAKAIKGPNGEPYLERYMLARWGDRALFLHRFLASDPDRGLHDHPWDSSASLIVCGGYQEKRLVKKNGKIWMVVRDLKAGDVNRIRGNDFHQVVLKPKTPAWTIFYHGPRVKTWGFAIPEGGSTMSEGEFKSSRYDVYAEEKPETKWEHEAPRGKNLPGRMPVNYSYQER